MDRANRIVVLLAYVLLVSVTAWSAWDTQRTLDRLEEDVCATAEIAVAAPLFNISIYGQQEGVSPEAQATAVKTLVEIADRINARCGIIFLDEIPTPDLVIPPLSLVPTTVAE